MMTIAASRALRSDDVCFVGIGAPSAACNVARLTHAPDITLIYECGTIGTAPDVLPLSIGDGELCDTAVTTVSVPEMFRYWLQGGRITIGFLGAAQLDRFGNINTTVIGDYAHRRRGCPAAAARRRSPRRRGEIYITMAQSRRGMVEKIDFDRSRQTVAWEMFARTSLMSASSSAIVAVATALAPTAPVSVTVNCSLPSSSVVAFDLNRNAGLGHAVGERHHAIGDDQVAAVGGPGGDRVVHVERAGRRRRCGRRRACKCGRRCLQ